MSAPTVTVAGDVVTITGAAGSTTTTPAGAVEMARRIAGLFDVDLDDEDDDWDEDDD